MTFWLDKEDDYYQEIPLTEELLVKTEENLGHKLPRAYVKLLNEQNGGELRTNACPLVEDNTYGEMFVEVTYLFGIGENSSLNNTQYFIKEWGLPEKIVLINGEGHTWIALDYSNDVEQPSVIFIDTEENEITRLAPTFEQFIAALYVEEQEDFEEDIDSEDEISEQHLEHALKSGNLDEVIPVLNYLFFNKEGQPQLEQGISNLVLNESSELQNIGVHYAYLLFEEKRLNDSLMKLVLDGIHKQPFSIDQQVKIAMFDGRQSIIDID
ncbi:SMI1/KNR4 family protein [Viridibacillus arvi]|uniref:SMI1/KNR4 family protein n=1 Tax=Viridibacillus arvi TaxID=263475 RepID=UPI0039083D6A